MVAWKCCLSVCVLGAALSSSREASAEPSSSRAELTTLLDSGNVLNGGAAEPPLWEALGSLRSGRENRARLTLAGSNAGFWPGLSTSALLRLDLGLAGLGEGRAPTLRDASSALGVSWRSASGLELRLSAYPFDTDYVRLGYLHALDWGGTQAGVRESAFLSPISGAPGLGLALSTPRIALFSGVKWASVDAAAGSRRLWGVFGGGSYAFASVLRAELGFGFFQRPVGFLEGASLRLVWHRGAAEPEVTAEPFRPPSFRNDASLLEAEAPLGLALALEGTALLIRGQQRELAPAGALYGSARGRVFAGHAVLSWRSLAFVLRNDARFASQDIAPPGTAQQAELAAWLGGSFTLRPLHLVPSFEVGARLPAALETASAWPGVAQTWVAGGAAGLEPLPLAAARLPSIVGRLAFRQQLSTALSASVAFDYERNPNRVRLALLGATTLRVFDVPDSLVALGAVQARW